MFKSGDKVKYVREPRPEEWDGIGKVLIKYKIGDVLVIADKTEIWLKFQQDRYVYPVGCFEKVTDTVFKIEDIVKVGDIVIYLKNSALNPLIRKGQTDYVTHVKESPSGLRIYTRATDSRDPTRDTWLTSNWVELVQRYHTEYPSTTTTQTSSTVKIDEYIKEVELQPITLYRKDRRKPLSTQAGDISSALNRLPPIK